MYKYIGKNIPRQDAMDKVTGTGLFTHDISLPQMLHAKILRSPHAHARIVNIDVTQAEALPGVKAVITWENTPRVAYNSSDACFGTPPPGKPVLDQYVLDNVVRFVGDEVAAVAAETEAIAAAAVKLIKVDYEVLPAVFDPLEAIKDEAPDIHQTKHKNTPGEIFLFEVGEFEKNYANSEVTVDIALKFPIQKHAQLETNAAVADYKNGRLTVYSSTQGVHPTKEILALILGMNQNQIRVLNPPYVGGAFGIRCGLSGKAEPVAALLSIKTGRPVKYVYDRDEDFTASDSRHSGYAYVKLGASRDGIFQALAIKAFMNTGAYVSYGMEVASVMGAMALAIYRVPHIACDSRCVYTNIQPAGAMRGFGNPQGTVAIESAVDAMAKKLGMDPLELRLKNIIRVGDPWCLPFPCISTKLAECIHQAAETIDWKTKRAQPSQGRLRRGVGLAVGNHVSNSGPFCVDFDNIYLRLEADGSLLLSTGVPDIGQGSSTTLMQVAAEIVGADLNAVDISFSDTLSSPYDVGSHASRTLYAVGTCIVSAGKELKQEVLEYAARLMETTADKLTLEEGIIKGDGQTMSLKEVCHEAYLHGKQFVVVGRTVASNTLPWHAHAAEVEVDMETGMVTVVKLVAAHDCGTPINPQIVEGQIEGGLIMGMGYALREEIRHDSNGVAYNDGYHKYMLPTAGDIPPIEVILVESFDESGPFGAKGVGECGMVPTAAAILSAVENAIGIRFTEFPLTPERVLAGIQTSMAQKL